MGRTALALTDSAPQTAPAPLAAVPASVPAEHAPAEAPAPDGLEAADAAVKAAREGLQAAQRATDEARATLRSSRETKLGFERDFRAANGNPTESDRVWAGLSAAMRGVERSEAELARAEQVQRDAQAALGAATAARDAVVKQRNDATKAGRLAILRAELTVGGTARRDEGRRDLARAEPTLRGDTAGEGERREGAGRGAAHDAPPVMARSSRKTRPTMRSARKASRRSSSGEHMP